MKTPDIIYLQTCIGCISAEDKDQTMHCRMCHFEDIIDNVTFCEDRIDRTDTTYVSMEALRRILTPETMQYLTLELKKGGTL